MSLIHTGNCWVWKTQQRCSSWHTQTGVPGTYYYTLFKGTEMHWICIGFPLREPMMVNRVRSSRCAAFIIFLQLFLMQSSLCTNRLHSMRHFITHTNHGLTSCGCGAGFQPCAIVGKYSATSNDSNKIDLFRMQKCDWSVYSHIYTIKSNFPLVVHWRQCRIHPCHFLLK